MNAIDPPRNPLAYKNEDFLASDDARPLRILAEYIEPMQAFRREQICDTIVFFGSTRIAPDGPMGRFYEEARELARLVTGWSKSRPSHSKRYVVCTGGGSGIMEAANRGASDVAGRTIGLNIGLPSHSQARKVLPGPVGIADTPAKNSELPMAFQLSQNLLMALAKSRKARFACARPGSWKACQ